MKKIPVRTWWKRLQRGWDNLFLACEDRFRYGGAYPAGGVRTRRRARPRSLGLAVETLEGRWMLSGNQVPVVQVSAPSGPFTGAPFLATATVAGVNPGVDDTPAGMLEGVTPTLAYFDAAGNPLPGAPGEAGTYTAEASFAGSIDYTSASASTPFTIDPALYPVTPTLTVRGSDTITFVGGPLPGVATVAGVVAGVDDSPSNRLEGVAVNLSYLDAMGNPLPGAPIQAGTYTLQAAFPGSVDYTSTWASVPFTVNPATPFVRVSDPSGTFTGAPFGATVSVAGTGYVSGPTLEGVAPSLSYFDAGGNPLPAAPVQAGSYTVLASFAGSTDYTSASATTTFTIASANLPPVLTLGDASGTFTGAPFPASVTVAGVRTGVDDVPGGAWKASPPP